MSDPNGFTRLLFYIIMEIFKNVPNYEDLYQVSNLGKVKSLKCNKIKILKPSIDGYGYQQVALSKDKTVKRFKVHQLIAMAFLGHKPCGCSLVIDHINNNRIDNRLENINIVTQRQNVSKRNKKYTSKYVGVHWDKTKKKWRSRILVNGRNKHIGDYNNEYDAHQAYQKALSEIC